MLKFLETQKLPKGSGTAVNQIRKWNRLLGGYAQVISFDELDIDAPYDKFFCKQLSKYGDIGSDVIMFKRVPKHTDRLAPVLHNKREVKPAFVMLVVHGEALVKKGNTKLLVKRGDVFALDPSIPHSVESDTLCICASVTVPKVTLKDL